MTVNPKKQMPERVFVMDRWFALDIGLNQIEARIAALAIEIREAYEEGQELVLLPVMNGALPFVAELIKHLGGPIQLHAIHCKSYEGMSSLGHVLVSLGLEKSNLEGKKVIVLEDIVDTGLTLHTLLPALAEMEPADLKVATLLHKPQAMLHDIKPDFVGFKVPTKFYVGYGLDYDGLGRELQGLYALNEEHSLVNE